MSNGLSILLIVLGIIMVFTSAALSGKSEPFRYSNTRVVCPTCGDTIALGDTKCVDEGR